MSLTVNPSDYQFEVQGTKYFMRFQMDIDIGEAFVAAQFDDAAKEWTGFIFGGADQVAIDYYGNGTIKGLVEYYTNQVNTRLEANHGEPQEGTLLEQENAFLHANVVLENERLKVI